MVCHKIKFIALVFAVTIGVFGFMPNQSNATGMYDMREFLEQRHPFDIGSPQKNQGQTPTAKLKKMAPPSAQTLQVAPLSPIYNPSVTRQPQKLKNALVVSKRNKTDPLLGFISGVRFAALAHDYGPFSSHKENGYNLNAEFLFASPKFLDLIWAPRPHLGIVRNSAGRTSQVYAGLTWDWSFWKNYFFEFAWGASRHNGNTTQENIEFKDLGCKTLFREALELGRQLGNHSLSLHFSHISNGKLCDKNEGLETLGLRYGYRF
jgi:lipid A 3-O-deacylase